MVRLYGAFAFALDQFAFEPDVGSCRDLGDIVRGRAIRYAGVPLRYLLPALLRVLVTPNRSQEEPSHATAMRQKSGWADFPGVTAECDAIDLHQQSFLSEISSGKLFSLPAWRERAREDQNSWGDQPFLSNGDETSFSIGDFLRP